MEEDRMYKIIKSFITALCIVFLFYSPNLYAQFPNDTHTVALYHFNEGSGSLANDASSNNNDGTIYGATYTSQGKFSYGLRFDGNNDRIKVSNSSSFSTINSNKELTVDMWVKISSYPSSGKEAILASKWGPGGDSDDEWHIVLLSDGRVRLTINSSTSSGSPNTVLFSSGSISRNIFHLLSFVWNGNTHEAAIYIDETRSAYTSSAVSTMPSTSWAMAIGGDTYYTTIAAFNGTIDEVRISNVDRYPSTSPYIQISNPNGGESWQLGSSHTISWQSNAGGNVKIQLYKGSSLYKTITSSTSNDGSYSWNIPTNYDEYSSYRIKITSTTNSSLYDYSNSYFSLTASLYITVTSPNGGEGWQLGSSHTISWQSNAGGNVKIQLYKGSSLYKTIASSTSNDGSYSWNIPTNYDEYSSYRIKITSTTNSSLYDYSNSYFSLNGGSGIPIYPSTTISQVSKNTEFWIDIKVGDNSNPVSNLFGTSFVLSFNQKNYIDVVTPHSSNVTPGSFMGNDLVFYSSVDEGSGKVNVGISRKTGTGGVSGSGTVLRVKFIANSNTPNNTKIHFSISEITANDPNGNSITLNPSALTVTIIGGKEVWPGDTNNDKIVNQADVLPIGLFWEKSGPARSNASISWTAQICEQWTPENATYADATGDGIVNQADILPIGLNWAKTHPCLNYSNPCQPNKNIKFLQNPTLQPKTESYYQIHDQNFYIEVFASDVTDLFGLSFELVCDKPHLLQFISVEQSSFLGSDIVFYYTKDDATGKIAVGISRKAGQGGVTGEGSVIKVTLKILTNAPFGEIINFSLQNVTANDSNGSALAFALNSLTITIGTTAVELTKKSYLPQDFKLFQNSPNPFNPTTTITYSLPAVSQVNIEVFNSRGVLISKLVDGKISAGNHSVVFNAIDLPSGLYFYKIQAGNFNHVKKMLLIK